MSDSRIRSDSIIDMANKGLTVAGKIQWTVDYLKKVPETVTGMAPSPALDGEGKPVNINPPLIVSDDVLNKVTDNGKNTAAIFDKGLKQTLIDLGLIPPIPVLIPSIPAQPSPSEGIIGTVITDESRLMAQQLWNFKVVFFNHKQQEYPLYPHTIKQLVIKDDFLSWPIKGYIIVDNRMEAFERSESGVAYHIRSDARDEVHIEIWPTVNPLKSGPLPDDIFKLKTTLIMYDIEDIPHENMTTKMKKIYFWDKNFQNLLEKNIDWCTSTGKRYISPECPKPIAHQTDELKSMYTGEAIRSLLEAAGYGNLVDTANWDYGYSKINYTAKADWSIWENIQYILTLQTSKLKQDICMLNWERHEEKWSLLALGSYFEKAGKSAPGELQREHLFLEENISTANESTSPYKAPLDPLSSYDRDIKITEFSKITNYEFSQTSGLDNSKTFVTKPIYSHWHRKKQFDVDVKENEIVNVKKYLLDNYVINLMGNNYPVMVLNKTKKEVLSIDPQFSPHSNLNPDNDRKMRSTLGKGQTLYSNVFANQCLSVRLLGSTHRFSGTFIGVDRMAQSSDTIYDYSLCGQYFVVSVDHIIQNQKYVTDLTMVKIHAYDVLPDNEGVY